MTKKVKIIFIFMLLRCGIVFFMSNTGYIQLRQGIKPPIHAKQNTNSSLTGKLLTSPHKSHEGVLALIKNAKYTIDIRGYQISDKEIINALKEKSLQGVTIRIILENSTYGEASKDYLYFIKQTQKTPIQVKSDEHLETNFQHAKTMIIDNESFLISSANFTYGGFFANREHRFLSSDETHTTLLTQQFEADRTDNEAKRPKLIASLRICPYNCREELTQLITSAQTEIIIQAQYLEDQVLIDQLVEKIKSGINIRIIVGKYHDTLLPQSLGETVRTMSDPNVHAKAIAIDGTKLHIGSMNLSTNAVEKNREIGIVTNDKYVIRQFLGQFDQDRQSIAP